MTMALDLSPLEAAVMQLEEALEIHDSELALSDPRLKRHLRAAVIQAFEFTYELSFRMLRRYLELASPNPAEIDGLVFNEIIRESYRQALVRSELPVWREYRRNRGTTSLTDNEEKAQEVFESVPDFLQDARYLLNRLRERSEALDDPSN
ncbi:MAG: HI0074 family nucleotidyltransferase substrate-binding subunit [Dehalococcoidia bacterium]|nr:HI0074 family nucleotidyltransferase substrate-binding subunit [Dehalococcoidia bacterium]